MTAIYLQIALPIPLRRLFDYLPPAGYPSNDILALQAGTRIKVPFGNRQLIGVLIGTTNNTEVPPNKLKPVIAIIDNEPLVKPELLSLAQWTAGYYQAPFGEALLSVLPTLLREGKNTAAETETWWQLTTHGKGLPEGALQRAPKQAELLSLLQKKEHSQEALKQAGINTTIIRTLEKKQLIENFQKTIELKSESSQPTDKNTALPLLRESNLPLNDEQQTALTKITAAKNYAPFLLQGITGSGKTEVYLQAIEDILKNKKQALVLIPEIGLTPQTINRFKQRFNVPIVAFHSGLNNKERLHAWLHASQNKAAIVIGTRSAIFTPMPNLGMIIIDEEHDSSFKQQDRFRYHARSVAMVRGQREKVPVILGSATPALETLRNAQSGRYQYLRLTQRAGNAQPPSIHILDTSKESLQEGFSKILLDGMQQELQKDNQVLVFLNRRGYAPVLLCPDCGWMAHCSSCDTKLTVHKQQKYLRCHHCSWQEALPKHCAECNSSDLQALGLGTQRSEEMLQQYFPDTPIIRIDRDSTANKNAMPKLLQKIQQQPSAILLGTQMLAKGHHFPNITLVAILDADSGLFSADFRSAEKLGQLLIQVSGRAGRADKAGHVIVQSGHSDHPLMHSIAQQDYDALAQQLLNEREHCDLPPYCQQAVLRSETTYANQGEHFLRKARQQAEALIAPQSGLSISGISIIGPLPALMEKRANRFRYELIFSSPKRPALQKLLTDLSLLLEKDRDAQKVRWAIDVDPV